MPVKKRVTKPVAKAPAKKRATTAKKPVFVGGPVEAPKKQSKLPGLFLDQVARLDNPTQLTKQEIRAIVAGIYRKDAGKATQWEEFLNGYIGNSIAVSLLTEVAHNIG